MGGAVLAGSGALPVEANDVSDRYMEKSTRPSSTGAVVKGFDTSTEDG